MSIEVILYPRSATKRQLRDHVVSRGNRPCEHLWKWPEGSLHFSWYDPSDFRSFGGLGATIYPPSAEEQEQFGRCAWALHTRGSGLRSTFDYHEQNEVIRSGRQKFGGNFYNDWHGTNRYTPVDPEPRTPEGRGLFLAYEYVKQKLGAVMISLPPPAMGMDGNKTGLERFDPVRVLYNAVVPFAVAAMEFFFSRAFTILVRYDPRAKARLAEQKRKVDVDDVLAVSRGQKTIEGIIARWYSFQSIHSIHAAYSEWFSIDFWKIIRRRKRIGRRLPYLERKLNEIIAFRHGVVHGLDLQGELDRDAVVEILQLVEAVIDVFVDHLERARGIIIRDEAAQRSAVGDGQNRAAPERQSR